MKLKKILSLLLAVTMLFSCIGITAMAEETATEVEYVALIAGADVPVTNLNDAFTDEYNPNYNSVILLKDCAQDVDITSGGAYSFYLNGHTLTGSFKLSDGVVNFNGSLAGTTEEGAESVIQNTGLDGSYPLWCENGNFNLSGDVKVIATEENGTAIYSDGSKMTITGAIDVKGNVETGTYGIISITNGNYNGSLIKGTDSSLEVVGGTFSEDPSACIPNGYKAVLENGIYTVEAKEVSLDDLDTDAEGAYLISTPDDVVTFRTLLNTTEGKNILSGVVFKVTKDIDMSGFTLAAAGNDSKRFMGTFDGQNHIISNVNIQAGDTTYVAFFGNISGATIKDITLDNVTVVGGSYTAGLVGFTRNSTIENCAITGVIDISGSSHVGGIHAGGVVTITDCEVSGTGTISGSIDVGAISGLLSEGSTTVTGNSVSGITIEGDGLVGGLIGRAIAGSAGLEVSGNSLTDVEVISTADSYNQNGLVVGCTQAASGKATYEDNATTGSTLTVDGKVSNVVYCTTNFDGTDYSENVEIPGPAGTITYAYTTTGTEKPIWGEAKANSKESFKIKLYEGEKVIATTELNNVGGIIDGTIDVTWSFWYSASDEYWNTTWEEGYPNASMKPDKVVLYSDGVAVAENEVQLNAPDNLNKIVAAAEDKNGNFLGYTTDIQEAITAAAPNGTVEILADVTVDKWIMFSETLSIGDGRIITLESINGLTINGNNKTLTINSVESANNGDRLFYDATNLNINNLTIKYADGVSGGIGLKSGTISGVTFDGGIYGVLPGTGEVKIEGCTFKTNGTSIYFEEARDNLVVTGNTFENASDANVILLRGDVEFTDNIIISGRTVNVVSGSPVVSGNNFGEVRFKVYNDATATITNNEINNLAFGEASDIKSTFSNNTLSEAAQSALDAVTSDPVEVDTYEELVAALAKDNANIIMTADITATATQSSGYGVAGIVLNAGDVLDGNGHKLTINGANTTWDCAVAMRGGEVKNLTIAGAMRGIFMPGANGDVIIDSCIIEDVIYTFNSDAGSTDYSVTIKNTTLNGWTSYSKVHKSVAFEGCTFGEGNGYAYCRPYQPTTFTGCEFNKGFEFDTTRTAAETLKFDDCTYAGEELSTESAAPMFSDGGTVVIDGETVVFGEYNPVAKIGDTPYATFEDALNAVEDGETITLLDITGSELSKEIDFTKEISFTITGDAPNYALPVVTFLNATVTIKDAEILIPELDARQNATINVVDSIVHDAGGNSIVKSYYNGAINISGTSVVHTMQVTTMGYITISDTAKLNATWQTNVYGNGMITVKDNATFATAALHLTGQDYSGRDNTDTDRVGKPAAIVVDGANFTVGKVYSDNGADYSYNSSKGINIGTIDGKSAVLDIKNGATVNIYMANGETANIGADGTVNVSDSALITACRKADGTVTLANNGAINVSGTSDIAAKVTGTGWVYMNGVTLDADTKLYGAKVRFASGTNNVEGSVIDDGFFQVGIGAYNGVDANVDTTNGVTVNVKNAKIGSNGETYAGWIGTGFYDTDAEKAAAMTDAKYILNIENSIAEFGYIHISNDGELNVNGNATEKVWYNNSDYSFYAGDFIINGVATFDTTDVLAIYTKVSCDNGTDKPGTLNIKNGADYEAERHNGAIAGTNFDLRKTGVVNVENAKLHIGEYTSIAAGAVMNIGGEVTALGEITNSGTINLTTADATLTTPEVPVVNSTVDGYEVVYADGKYSMTKVSYVAQIGETKYTSLQKALDAAAAGTGNVTVEILDDIDLSETVTVAQGKDIILDLAGYTITGRDTKTSGNYELISNKGTLTVKDSSEAKTGTITLTATTDRAWNAYSAVIANLQGTLTVESGIIKHLGGTSMAYAIDNNTNGNGGSAILTVSGGTIDSTYRGIRQFANSTTCENKLTITGGTVSGTNRAVWLQSANAKANIAATRITGGTVGSVYVWAPADADASSLSLEANSSNVEEIINGLPEGYEIKNSNGKYGIYKTPNAEVTVLEPLTLEADSYMVWPSGVTNIDRPLEIVMNFKANDTLDEALAGGYSKWLVDFNLKFTGLATESITADNCYLAGNYGGYGWIVIPADGLVIEEGVSYPVVANYDATLNYKDICESVQNFTAAIHVDPAILEANPDFKVELSLVMTNPNDETDTLVIGEPAVYTAEDLMGEVEEVELFDLFAANVTLGNSLAMNFAINKSDITGTDYYAEIKHYAESEVKTIKVDFADWTVDTTGNYYVVTYSGLTAKQIVDDLEVTIYRNDGTQVSNVWEDGLRVYALRMMEKTLNKSSLTEKDNKLMIVLADMLNYGAAAQREFSYKVDALATDGVDEKYMAYASEMPEISDVSERDADKCFGSTLSLKDSIILKAAFKGVSEGMYATVSFTKHTGTDFFETITYPDMEKSGSYVIINVDDLVIADAEQVVTITIYDADGNVYTVFKDSMNSYIKRNIGGGDASRILEMTAKFTSSAYNTLH